MIPAKGLRSVILLAILVIVVWQSAFIVAPDEEGVVKRFGKVVRTVGPGPHLKLPFIETVLLPKVGKLHRIEIGFRTDRQNRIQVLPQEAQMLTDDLNIIRVEFIVQYKIKNAIDYLFNVADVEDTIEKAAEAAMREVIGKSKIDDALTTGKAQIQDGVQTLLQQILDHYHAGVQVAAVQLKDVNPPDAVAAAFKDVQSAREDREKLINEAQGYRNDIIPKAKGEAAQLINQAKGYAQARIARAEGEASRFLKTLKEYEQAREIISKRIYLETMEEVLGEIDKVILDTKASDRMLLYLPLDRLKAQPAPGQASTEKKP
jgi:membrane protease subunit HflK